ncbi:hypothetical protein HG536_0D04110 [Torulaspora globosa]|uniref:YBL029W n=1 Tax=Torulaspora globosa TaxID=48254 RepID=A0A7G3ZHA3_9SACH|nr:uncharacterized protein HG536_0D04110 [Torulaspora globosa]QLL32889.1 hypothetical protein HG536_0D04110 [Torulaspora globosa]
MFSQMADDHGFWPNSGADFELEPYQFDSGILNENEQAAVETISPILTVSISPFFNSDFDESLMVSSMGGSIGSSSYSLGESDSTALERDLETPPLPVSSAASSFVSDSPPIKRCKTLPRTPQRPAGPSSPSPCRVSRASSAGSVSGEHKKVSDSRLSAQGLAKVLKLDSPEEALKRERYILDIFENELHYPLGYKTWVRDTFKDYRVKLIDQLHERVKHKYPEYDHAVLETIIRRATYYMMQSRLRRERRARAKGVKMSQSNANTP